MTQEEQGATCPGFKTAYYGCPLAYSMVGLPGNDRVHEEGR